MPFSIDQMKSLYLIPRGKKRFEKYLMMLQGEKKEEMILPISGFNPMRNELVELLKLEAEKKHNR